MDKLKEKIIISFLLFVNLGYFYFFRPMGVDDTTLKFIYYCFLGTTILLSLKIFFTGPFTRYGGLMRGLIFSILISICSAYIFWGQGIPTTAVASIPYLSFFIFFFLWEQNTNIDTIEKIIWIFCLIFLICYFYALFKAPERVFKGYGEIDEAINTSRGIYRIRLTIIGGGPLFIAYFLSLTKYKITQHKKWIGISLFLFLVIIMQLGRQAIFYSFILTILFFSTQMPWKKKVLFLLGITLISWYMVFSNPIVNRLISMTQDQYERQLEQNTEDVRVSAYKFYLFNVSPSIFTTVFGNGMYAIGKSSYGNYINTHGRYRGYIPADVGYAAIYLIWGLLGLSIVFIILFRALKQEVPDRYAYAKYYIMFLMLGSITGNTLLASIPTFCMALYILDLLDRADRLNTKQQQFVHKKAPLLQ